MSRSAPDTTCAFCGGPWRWRYAMGRYGIWQCRGCATGRAWPVPSPDEIAQFYHGFSKNLKADLMPRFREGGLRLFRDFGLSPGRKLRMLDVGGGGGFFARAFEDLGFGESTFVDVDALCCAFAAEQLGLARVLNFDAVKVADAGLGRFDLIYSRHVVEHLTQPTEAMEQWADMLAPGGLLVVHCPNGDSLEYLAYLRLNLRSRLGTIRRSSNLSRPALLWTVLTGGMLHGMDPPRHLWAISRRGMRKWSQRAGLACRIRTYHLGDPAHSPHYKRQVGLAGEVVGMQVLSRLRGGAHLVARLSRRAGLAAGPPGEQSHD